MKRWLLALMMTATLAACDNSPADSAPSTPPASKPGDAESAPSPTEDEWGLPSLDGFFKEVQGRLVTYEAQDDSFILVQNSPATKGMLLAFENEDDSAIAYLLGQSLGNGTNGVSVLGELHDIAGGAVFTADVTFSGQEDPEIAQQRHMTVYCLPGEDETLFYIIGSSCGTTLVPGMETIVKALQQQ